MHFRPRVLCGEDIKKQCDGKSTTPKGVVSSLALLPRVGRVPLANPALSIVQPRCGRGTPCGLMEMGRGGLHMDGWFPLGGLYVNGSFVCVGCVEKYDGDG